MKIILGADHGGFELKNKIKELLVNKGIEVVDVGAFELNTNDDFVDYAKEAISKFLDGDRLILFCRNGYGMSIMANRYKGIRCGIAFDEKAVEKGRNDDDINCLSVPSDYIDESKVIKMIDIFLNAVFSGDESYVRRINKIDN